MNFFLNCMQVLVHNKCPDLENVFTELSQMFLSNTIFFTNCSRSSKLLLKKGTEILTESTTNISDDRKDIKKTIISSSSPNSVIAGTTPEKVPHYKNEIRTFDPIYQVINDTQDPYFKESFDENETTELHSQILSPPTKSSDVPLDQQSQAKEYNTENSFKTMDKSADNLESNSPSSPNTPPNSSNPIIIHKTTFITLTYRGKNGGSNVSAVMIIVYILVVCLCLHSKSL